MLRAQVCVAHAMPVLAEIRQRLMNGLTPRIAGSQAPQGFNHGINPMCLIP
jgi:hypothetical protein